MIRERDLHTGPRGLRIRLRETGVSGQHLPVVVLHGFLEQAASWDEVAAALAPRHVVALDHRGHGHSEHVGPGGFYHFWDYVADVDAVIDDLGGRVDLVGHSMGGAVACLVAGTVADKVRRLVVIEGLGPPDGVEHAVGQARRALKHRRDPPVHRPIADLDEAVARMHRGNRDIPTHRAYDLAARATAPTDDGLSWRWDALHRARSPQAFSATQFTAFLREITAPTLLVEGADSPFGLIPDLDARRAALANHRRIVVEGCGHHPHYTHVPTLAGLIREHLDG